MVRKKSNPDHTPPFIKYTGLAIQMMAIIGLGTWLGYLLDEKIGFDFPIGLLGGCFLFTAVALYQLYKSLPKD